ncbi:MAG: putative bifunctional diguanylate cyclase/phosphodiesterase [Burkholderiales bacterium]
MNASGSLRVLIVEDSSDDALLLAEKLKNGGYELAWQCVDSPSELQQQMRNRDWDLILCDNDLPELDARRALEIVRRHRQEIPFIIVAGGMSEEEASEVMKCGASDYISKHNLSRLIPAIGRELRNRARLNKADGKPTVLSRRQDLLDRLDATMRKEAHLTLVLVEFCRYRELLKELGVAREPRLLDAFSERLCGLRCGQVLGRINEDLFILVMRAGGDAQSCGRAIVELFRHPLRMAEEELYVSCRVGGSMASAEGMDAEILLGQAETALQQARNPESGGVSFYSRSMERRGRKKLELEKALYQAVHNDEFSLVYQPQYNLATGRMIGAEALLRWKRANGWLSPAEFIPLLEETGLIIPVGERILRRACEVNRNWQLQGLPEIRMAVNLSAIQFRQPDLAAMVSRILDETGLSARYLVLEITENIALHQGSEVISLLNELKALGLELALDDFGTGYSSLAYLKHFPIDKLKIDQSFVRDLLSDKSNEAIVMAILAIAESLGLTAIAEGVETLEQATLLEACGCAEVQGYYFCRPVSEEELKGLLAQARE